MLVISIILLPKYITEKKSMMLMLEFEAIILNSYFTGSLIIITIEVRLRTSFNTILYYAFIYDWPIDRHRIRSSSVVIAYLFDMSINISSDRSTAPFAVRLRATERLRKYRSILIAAFS